MFFLLYFWYYKDREEPVNSGDYLHFQSHNDESGFHFQEDYNERYLHEFKRDYSLSVGGKYNLKVQVKHLARLAEYYFNRYKKTDDWTDCLKARILRQHTKFLPFPIKHPGINLVENQL